jgi:uncharacterized coiled-coil protein SlyX
LKDLTTRAETAEKNHADWTQAKTLQDQEIHDLLAKITELNAQLEQLKTQMQVITGHTQVVGKTN